VRALEERLRRAGIQQAEVEAQLAVQREQYEVLANAKVAEEQSLKEEIQALKDSCSAEVEDYRGQKEAFEDRIQQIQRHLIQAESEFGKERALFA
jgi:uncharacterized protein involved in exopolysaccharide biosynthesis